jgi:hypothetical protein
MKSYKIRCCLELFSGLTSSLELFLGLTSFTRVSCCLELYLKGYIGFFFVFFLWHGQFLLLRCDREIYPSL